MMPSVSPLDVIINQNAIIRKLALSEHKGNNRFIAGYANIAGIVDEQGEVVTLDALKRAWQKWKATPEYCFINLIHTNISLAKVVFESVIDSKGNEHRSGVDDKGLYLVGQVRDDVTISDDIWKKIERGEYRGFSIGGRNLNPQPAVCDVDGCVREITDLELYEVSIVNDPANTVSLFNILKQDDLAVLSKIANKFEEQITTEGIIKISKTRGENCGKYHILIESDYIDPTPFETENTRVIRKEVEGMEYIPLFDQALLRPHGSLTGEARHGGVNPSPLTEETLNTPESEGDIPLNKEETEEVIEEKIDESPEDDSETPEALKTDEAPSEEEEAIAPMTLETLVAELAILNERVATFMKQNSEPEEEVEEEVKKSAEVEQTPNTESDPSSPDTESTPVSESPPVTETPPAEKPDTIEQPDIPKEVQETVEAIQEAVITQENVEAKPLPVRTETTDSKVEQAHTLANVTPEVEVIETRGRVVQVMDPAKVST